MEPTTTINSGIEGCLVPRPAAVGGKIWIDLENTPHVPFFVPIIRELQIRGFHVVVTARDAFQTCEMATIRHVAYQAIGRHYGKNKILKLCGLLIRAGQLLPFVRREKPLLAVNHGSRAQSMACNIVGVPIATLMDYEYSIPGPLCRAHWEIVPDVLPDRGLWCKSSGRMLKYSGLKEDVYVPEFLPNESIIQKLGLAGANVIVTVRPPATEAHYHNPDSDRLFEHFMDRLSSSPGIKAVLLPRNKRQKADITSSHPEWFRNVVVPPSVVDGLNLLWHSDLVVSGGGTMIREAAALGIPVYSIFRGKIGGVDRHLQEEGRLVLIESLEDVDKKILLRPRKRTLCPDLRPRKALVQIVDHLEKIMQHYYRVGASL